MLGYLNLKVGYAGGQAGLQHWMGGAIETELAIFRCQYPTMYRGDEKTTPLVPSGAVENEHKHCDPKDEERHDPCERQHAALTRTVKTVDWQVCETW